MTRPINEVRRHPERAAYDRDAINSILDDGIIAHMGLIVDGRPVVIPVAYARDGDHVLIHGSPASRLLRAYKAGAEACLTVTHLDGMVLARSAFNHSMNYRSVVLFGAMEEVVDHADKWAALDLLTEALVPGRSASLRPMTDKEVRATLVLRMPIDEASAKTRSGPPADGDEDGEWPVWAGVVPLSPVWGPPEPAPELDASMAVPPHVAEFRAAR